MARITPDIHWEPPKNLQVWGYSVQRVEYGVGDAFVAPAANIGNYANFYGAEVAKQHPDLDVYVVNISKGGANISEWLPNAESVNMMNAIKANMNAVMQELPHADSIDEIIWWGHESDAVPNAYITSDRFIEMFNVVINEIDEQPWIGKVKPRLRLHRLHPKSNRLASQINYALECLVQQNPQRVCLSDTTNFSYAEDIHLDPEEKEAAAKQVMKDPVFNASNVHRTPQANLLHNGDFSDDFIQWIAKGTEDQIRIRDGVVSLKDTGKLIQRIPRRDLQGTVVTFSVENVEHDLKVQIGNHIAYVYAGEGRRQASFALHSILRRKLRIAIESVDGKPATLSKVKLEYGGMATTYTHNPKPKDAKASLVLGVRWLKEKVNK